MLCSNKVRRDYGFILVFEFPDIHLLEKDPYHHQNELKELFSFLQIQFLK
jgi:hypothetical protein